MLVIHWVPFLWKLLSSPVPYGKILFDVCFDVAFLTPEA